MQAQGRDERFPFLEADPIPAIPSTTRDNKRIPLKSLSRSQSSLTRPFTKPNAAMISRLKNVPSIEWDSPTPKGHAPPHTPVALCDLDMLLAPAVDTIYPDNTGPIVPFGEPHAGNTRLAKSWNGKPGSPILLFQPEHTSTPPRYGTRVLSACNNAVNKISNDSTSLCGMLHAAPSWAPCGHLLVPASWPLQSAPFKRFPGSRVSDDCYECLPSLACQQLGFGPPGSRHPSLIDQERKMPNRRREYHECYEPHKPFAVLEAPPKEPCGKAPIKRKTVTRIPRLSSLQHLRPTPVVVASTKALVDEVRSTLQGARPLHRHGGVSDVERPSNDSCAESSCRRLSNLNTLSTWRAQPITDGASNIPGYKPPRLLQNPESIARSSDGIGSVPRTLRPSVSTGCLMSGTSLRRRVFETSWRMQWERPPSSCLSTVASDTDDY